MKFPEEFIERVSESSNIVDIISQYTQLKPSGGGFMGRCPFPDHPEKTASFSVSEQKQVYHCFGCQKKGNIFTFLRDYNGMSFPEAVEYLADRAQIALPEVDEKESAKQDLIAQKKKKILEINRLAQVYFREQFIRLPANHPAKVYVAKRELNAETQEQFSVGYATEAWDGLVQYLEKNKVSLQLAEEARLIKARTGGKSGYFDIFRERLMFPIHSNMGETIAFGGRIIQQGEPKYLNSPETLVFHKGRNLYGLSTTAKYIRTEDYAVVVEGYMDLVSIFQRGIQNVVATMGTALTSEHGRLLRRSTQNVVVLFDGDSAGQEAAERSLPLLLAADIHPKGVILPDDQDPDDYVKKEGAEALKNLLTSATDLFSLMLSQWLKDYRGDASQKIKLADRLKPLLLSIQDPRLKKLYFSEAVNKMGVDPQWLSSALAQGPKPASPSPAVKPEVVAKTEPKLTEAHHQLISLKGAPRAEILMMALALKNHANFQQVLEQNLVDDVTHMGVLQVLKRAQDVYRQAPEKFDKLTGLIATFVDAPELLFAPVTTQNAQESGEESEDRLFQDCVRKLRELSLNRQLKQLALEIKAQPSPEKMELMMKLQRDRLALRQ